jgi:hypothetical protein
VELLAGTDGGLRVRVRDGLVAVEGGGRHVVAPAGQEFVLRRDGSLVRRSLAPWGTEWRWVLEAAPPFAVEGSTVAELLAWVGRETGWRVRFEDPALAAEAGGIVLHGSLGDLAPDQVPFAVLPGAGLDAVLADGTLRVRRAAGGGG